MGPHCFNTAPYRDLSQGKHARQRQILQLKKVGREKKAGKGGGGGGGGRGERFEEKEPRMTREVAKGLGSCLPDVFHARYLS